MAISKLFNLRYDAIGEGGVPSYEIYSCVQWKGPNLDELSMAAEQRFCVMHNQSLNDELITALELAYLQGIFSPIRLIALHDDHLLVFFDSKLTSSSFISIQGKWEDFATLVPIKQYTLSFSNEASLCSDSSDYPHWPLALEVLRSRSLGMNQYKLHNSEQFDPADHAPGDMCSYFCPPGTYWD